MNIRPLAASGKSQPPSSTLRTEKKLDSSQVETAKARASWGKSFENKSVSFNEIRGNGTSSNSRATPNRQPTTPSVPTPKGPPTPIVKESPARTTQSPQKGQQKTFVQDALDVNNEGEEDDDGQLGEGRLRLPPWQVDLLDIYIKTNGDNWKEQSGWPTSSSLKPTNNVEIFGVTRPYNRPNEVVSIDLSWNNLNGDFNNIEGFWNIQTLEVLHLGANRLTGLIPGYELRRLVLLKDLHLYRNGLNGNIPAEIGQLKLLSSLWLFENHLSGKLPDSLGGLTSLTDLRCNSNRLSGPIPSALAQCVNLKTLNLQKNNFTGNVNEDVLMNCIRLRDLRLWSNKLTGALTPEIESLRFLEVLLLHQNQISWVIPPSLGKCEHLVKLDLSKNKLRGELPKTFGSLQKLESLNVSNNPRINGKVLSLPLTLSVYSIAINTASVSLCSHHIRFLVSSNNFGP
mmetsp:Transcript_951/g.1205  ORF Transcript_951/g.1205 Transcript_951/m.1205 type:complete len:456 (-) Transcript_951:233-1600(-)